MHFSSLLLIRTILATLLFLVLSFQGVAQAPSFAWAKSAGAANDDYGYGIAVDGNGNSYITGYFKGTSTFGSTTLSSSGINDVFIVKYDASGNVLWAQKAGGTGFDSGSGIAVDGSGNSYVTGHFQNTATFNSIILTSSGNDDIFIAKYDTSGTVLWAQQVGGNDNDAGIGIAVDGSGNSYVTGSFRNSATFGSITLTTSSGGDDIFIAKYSTSGNLLWAQKAGGIGIDIGYDIAIDSSGNSYVTGSFKNTAPFGSTTLSSSGDKDVFIAKYDPYGNVLWAQKAGGASIDVGSGIAVDGSGNSYITGYFYGTATFGNTTLTTSSSYDVFIAKYSTSGNLLWAQKAGGIDNDFGNGIAVDGSGNSYITGEFKGSATFSSTTIISSGFGDVFIAKYDTSGNLLWAQKAGGNGGDAGFGITIDSSGTSYVNGTFQTDATFGSSTLTSNGNFDVFIAKLGTAPLGLSSKISAVLSTYPNPFTTSFQLSLPGSGPATVVLIDVLGREVHRQISAESAAIITPHEQLPAGTYLLQARQGETLLRQRVVKL